MQISVTIQGLDELVSRLQDFTSSADQMIQETLLDSATENIVAVAKALAPVRTGALRDSIEALPGEEPSQILLVATKFYSVFLEFGTRYIPEGKYTFLRPAIQEGLDALTQALTEMFQEELA